MMDFESLNYQFHPIAQGLEIHREENIWSLPNDLSLKDVDIGFKITSHVSKCLGYPDLSKELKIWRGLVRLISNKDLFSKAGFTFSFDDILANTTERIRILSTLIKLMGSVVNPVKFVQESKILDYGLKAAGIGQGVHIFAQETVKGVASWLTLPIAILYTPKRIMDLELSIREWLKLTKNAGPVEQMYIRMDLLKSSIDVAIEVTKIGLIIAGGAATAPSIPVLLGVMGIISGSIGLYNLHHKPSRFPASAPVPELIPEAPSPSIGSGGEA